MIIKPAFQAVVKILPGLDFIERMIDDNKVHWSASVEEYEEVMKDGN